MRTVSFQKKRNFQKHYMSDALEKAFEGDFGDFFGG